MALQGYSPEEINNFNKVVGGGLNRVAGLGGVGPRQPQPPRFQPEVRASEGMGFVKNKPSYVTPSAAVQGPIAPKNPVTGVSNALKGGLAAGFGLYANKDAIADYAGDLGESYGLGAYGPNGSVSQGVSNVGNKIVDDWSGSIARQAEANRQSKGLGGFISGLGSEAYKSFVAPAIDVGKGAYEFGRDVYNTVTKDYEDDGKTPPALQNGAQAAPTKTETKQPPKTTDTQKPVVTPETPLQASMNDISLARQMGEGDGTGYVTMPGNPGNYRNDTDENNIEGVIYMGNAMPGLAGQTKMQKEGITGYDVNGKPFFNRTEPATYTIQDGQVKKFDQNGKAVGLSAFANSPNSSGIGTNAQGQYVGYGNSADPNAVNPFAVDMLAKAPGSAAEKSAALDRMNGMQSPQVGGLAMQAPQMPDYSQQVNSLLEQATANVDPNDSIGTLVTKKANRNQALRALGDVVDVQNSAQNSYLDYALGQQNNLLDAQKAAMIYQNDARNLQNSEQQQDFNQRLGLAELALKARPQPTEYQPIFEDQWDDQAGAMKKVYMGNLDKRTGAISRPEGNAQQQQPYADGTELTGPGGKKYIVKNGVPVLAQ